MQCNLNAQEPLYEKEFHQIKLLQYKKANDWLYAMVNINYFIFSGVDPRGQLTPLQNHIMEVKEWCISIKHTKINALFL